MLITTGSLFSGAREAVGTAIIIDVFRAFTTAAVALSRGADRIILVGDPGRALELRDQGKGDLCMGEVAGIRPDAFDLGNSPFELSQADVKGKTLIHSTSAGTTGVTAAKNADQIYLGSLVIAEATAKALVRRSPDVISIVAMGDGGEIRSDEDEQCAMYLRNLIQGRRPDRGAVRTLVLAGGESQKYDDPTLSHFHPRDREIALQIDSIPFAIRVSPEDGLLVARPEAV